MGVGSSGLHLKKMMGIFTYNRGFNRANHVSKELMAYMYSLYIAGTQSLMLPRDPMCN